MIIASRPDSILWQTDGLKVDKSAQFKSKKIGALEFGALYSLGSNSSAVLSVSETHLVLIETMKNKVLSYF